MNPLQNQAAVIWVRSQNQGVTIALHLQKYNISMLAVGEGLYLFIYWHVYISDYVAGAYGRCQELLSKSQEDVEMNT